MTKLYVALVNDALNEGAYAASLAGLQFDLGNVAAGLQLLVNGYSDKLPELLHEVLRAIAGLEIRPDRFTVMQQEVVRELENFPRRQPVQYAQYMLGVALERYRTHISDQLAAARTLTLPVVQAFGRRLARVAHVELLVHGNFTPADALAFADRIDAALQPRAADVAYFQQEFARLPTGARLVLQEPGPNPDNDNNAVVLFFQAEKYSPRQAVLLDLCSSIASEPLFSQLRTKEQLGMSCLFLAVDRVRPCSRVRVVIVVSLFVSCSIHPGYMVQSAARRNAASVQSFEVTVQSAVRDPVYLHMRILEWARSMEVRRRLVPFLYALTLVAEHDGRAATGGI